MTTTETCPGVCLLDYEIVFSSPKNRPVQCWPSHMTCCRWLWRPFILFKIISRKSDIMHLLNCPPPPKSYFSPSPTLRCSPNLEPQMKVMAGEDGGCDHDQSKAEVCNFCWMLISILLRQSTGNHVVIIDCLHLSKE